VDYKYYCKKNDDHGITLMRRRATMAAPAGAVEITKEQYERVNSSIYDGTFDPMAACE